MAHDDFLGAQGLAKQRFNELYQVIPLAECRDDNGDAMVSSLHNPKTVSLPGIRVNTQMSEPPRSPIISILTVVLNDRENLQKTIDSVDAQTYPFIEFLVIDGGSSDGTLDIIRENQSSISLFVSEQDLGIYHAMNKGVALASGEFMLFLNAGDTFFNQHSLQYLATCLQPRDKDAFYLCHAIKDTGGLLRAKRSIIKKLFSLPACHQAILYPATAMRKYNYDLKFRIAADYHQFLRMSKTFSPIFIDMVLVKFDTKGISSRSRKLLVNDLKAVYQETGTTYISVPLLFLDSMVIKFKSALQHFILGSF